MIIFYIKTITMVSLDADGREIHTCYTYDTTVEYRPNIKQLLILLVPSNNSACDIFPAGVNINVTIGNTDFATTVPLPVYLPYSYTISNFGYQNTTQIAVEGFSLPVDGLGDEISIDFLLIEIYSYSEITRIEILEMQTIISSLSECFYADMPMLVTKDSLFISMNATGLCRIQIGALKSLHVTIEGKQFSFNLTQASLVDLKTNYNHNVKFNVSLTPSGTNNFLFTAEESMISSTAYILTEQGGVETRIDLQLSSCDFLSISNFYSEAFLTFNDRSFVFAVQSAPLALYQMEQILIANGQFPDSINVRFEIILASKSYTFDSIFAEYNPLKKYYIMKCEDVPSNEKAACQSFYDLCLEAKSATILISILLYSQSVLILAQHDRIQFKPPLYERAFLEVRDSSVCVHMQQKMNAKLSGEVKVQLKLIDNETLVSRGVYNLQTTYNDVELCFTGDTAVQLKENAYNYVAQMEVVSGSNSYTTVFWNTQTVSYKKSNTAAFSLIGVAAIVRTVFIVYQIASFQKKLKLLKKKKQ
ncbi:Conserved_hypothetical protein [Hexamita inflata]|uniref:Uncharacterized protein n=1 Tax=Hexamita inflata TaxID=28002 RepID=A0AA86NAF0_9EUKA|nr:Conserved hypothetical protein [Hexamita inflata]